MDVATDLSHLFDLSGKVAFIPGGAGGLGEAIAWGMAAHGASVAIGGRDVAKAKALSEALSKAGHNAIAVGMDAADISTIERAVGQVADHFGRIDILVNCVGIQIEQPLLDVTEDAFDQAYESSLKAAMFIAQAVAKRQIAGGNGGRQIHLLSVRSQLGIRARGYSAYCATRGGLVMLVKQHAWSWPLITSRSTVSRRHLCIRR